MTSRDLQFQGAASSLWRVPTTNKTLPTAQAATSPMGFRFAFPPPPLSSPSSPLGALSLGGLARHNLKQRLARRPSSPATDDEGDPRHTRPNLLPERGDKSEATTTKRPPSILRNARVERATSPGPPPRQPSPTPPAPPPAVSAEVQPKEGEAVPPVATPPSANAANEQTRDDVAETKKSKKDDGERSERKRDRDEKDFARLREKERAKKKKEKEREKERERERQREYEKKKKKAASRRKEADDSGDDDTSSESDDDARRRRSTHRKERIRFDGESDDGSVSGDFSPPTTDDDDNREARRERRRHKHDKHERRTTKQTEAKGRERSKQSVKQTRPSTSASTTKRVQDELCETDAYQLPFASQTPPVLPRGMFLMERNGQQSGVMQSIPDNHHHHHHHAEIPSSMSAYTLPPPLPVMPLATTLPRFDHLCQPPRSEAPRFEESLRLDKLASVDVIEEVNREIANAAAATQRLGDVHSKMEHQTTPEDFSVLTHAQHIRELVDRMKHQMERCKHLSLSSTVADVMACRQNLQEWQATASKIFHINGLSVNQRNALLTVLASHGFTKL